MQKFINLVQNNQSFLLERILKYARRYGYTKYTPTLEEDWAGSIAGVSKALTEAMIRDPRIPEIIADHDDSDNPISNFGVLEAQRHRRRGVSLHSFLSLMKYYRQAYLDLLEEFVSEFDQPQIYRLWINRFFDQNEIAFVYEWTSVSKETLISELQDANLSLTNEKNKYLTIFESSPVPIIVFGSAHRCINMNYAAQQLLYQAPRFPGLVYDTAKPQCPEFNEVLPWLNQEYEDFCRENEVELQIEKEFNSPAWGYRYLDIKLHRMLDVSGKFDGTVIRFNDLTDLKKIESKLRQLGFHDQLTGLYNRAYLDEEVKRLANGGFNPVGFISIDIDGMKLVNDHFGHIAGDTLLKDVSQILKESFRASDIVVRMGGDEFGVLLPSCDAETAEQACQRVRNYVKKKNESGAELPISLSIGWAIGNFNDKSDIDQMIKNADAQMYSEKQINHQAYQVLFQERFGSEKAW